MAIAASPRSEPTARHARPRPVLVGRPDDAHDADATIRALVAAQEQERRRIARDLHDVVGQALTAVKLNLEALRRDAPDRRSDADLRRSIALVDQAVRDVRDVAIDLRPSILDDLGLVAAIRWYVLRQGRLAGYRASFAADPIPLGLDDELETACFRALQEALTNVARHAHATRVRVELRRTPVSIDLLVEDDGVGFDVVRSRRKRPTLGLIGMSERVATIGGSIEIRSEPGNGTRIRASFPRVLTLGLAGDR